MIRVLFVCLGNICRSPMAEFVFKDMVKRRGLSHCFAISSAGTSSEEEGNPVHAGTQKALAGHGVPCCERRARRLRAEDYFEYDYILGMETRNISNMLRIFGGDPEGKLHRLSDFSKSPRDIADPWYTGNFETAYRDICEGCAAFLQYLRAEKKI